MTAQVELRVVENPQRISLELAHVFKGDKGDKGDPGNPGTGADVKQACYDSRNVPGVAAVPCDDVTNAHAQAQAAIDKVRDLGGGILFMVGDDPSKRFFFNASVWAKTGVWVVWINKVLMGQYGRTGILGQVAELGTVGDNTYFLSQDALNGTNTLHVGSNGAEFLVGDMLEMRGENDANGVAIERQRVTVTARTLTPGDNTLTISPPLSMDFLAAYPLSQWANDRTTIKRLAQSALLTLTEGSPSVVVSDASGFAINDTLLIEDMMIAGDISGTSNNQIHMEVNTVRSVDLPTNTLYLQFPLAHTYNAAKSPHVVKTLPARNAAHINLHIYYAQRSIDTNRHACQLLHARDCRVDGLKVIGTPNEDPLLSLGSRGHGCRVGDGCIGNYIHDFQVTRPAFWDAGEGYGLSFYSGARYNRAKTIWANGCRHSVLFFKGVTNNFVDGVISVDCRGTHIDFHGANERKNTVTNCRLAGGPSTTPDIGQKAGIKFGNPTHRAGPSDNVVRGVEVDALEFFLAHFLPGARNKLEGVTGTSARGLYFQVPAAEEADATRKIVDTTCRNIEMFGGTKHVEVDGGLNKGVDKLRLDKVIARTPTQQGASFKLANAQKLSLIDCEQWDALSDGTVTSSYLVDASDVTALEVIRHRGDGAKRFISLLNCPNALIDRPQLTNQLERYVMYDAGGNTNMRLIDYETVYDAAFVDAGAPSAGIARVPRRRATNRVVCALAPQTFAAGAPLTLLTDNTPPLDTEGVFIMQQSIKPRIPKGLIAVMAVFPYVAISATNTTTITAFYRQNGGAWNLIPRGLVTLRLTTGATAGNGGVLRAEFRHSLEDLSGTIDVMIRLGVNSNAATITLGGEYNGNDMPMLVLDEVVEL
jgi:hypothetical protein